MLLYVGRGKYPVECIVCQIGIEVVDLRSFQDA